MKFKNEKHYWCQSWVDKVVLTFSFNSIGLLLLDSALEQELMLKVGSIWLFTSGKNILMNNVVVLAGDKFILIRYKSLFFFFMHQKITLIPKFLTLIKKM